MIGAIIKNMRLKNKMSQKELGIKLNLADTTISSYERENSNPTFEMILKIANECGYNIIFSDNENKIYSVEELSKEMDF